MHSDTARWTLPLPHRLNWKGFELQTGCPEAVDGTECRKTARSCRKNALTDTSPAATFSAEAS